MKPCPPHKYCPQESTEPHTCATLYRAAGGGTECKPTSQLLAIIISLSVAAAAAVVVVIYRWRKAKQKADLEKEVLLRAYSQRRKPVYSGL